MRPLRLVLFLLLLTASQFAAEAAGRAPVATHRFVCAPAAQGSWYEIRSWSKRAIFEAAQPVPADKLAQHLKDELKSLDVGVMAVVGRAVYVNFSAQELLEMSVAGPAVRLETWRRPLPAEKETKAQSLPHLLVALNVANLRQLQLALTVVMAAFEPDLAQAGVEQGRPDDNAVTRCRRSLERALRAVPEERYPAVESTLRCLLADWETRAQYPQEMSRPAPRPATRTAPHERGLVFGGYTNRYEARRDGVPGIETTLELLLPPDKREGARLALELYYSAKMGDQTLAGRPVPSPNGKYQNAKGFCSVEADLSKMQGNRVTLFLPLAEIDDGWAGGGKRLYTAEFVLYLGDKVVARQANALNFALRCEQRNGRRECGQPLLGEEAGEAPAADED